SNINNSYAELPTYSWDVNVVGHELGHNFGSRHTHWCGWPGGPIDNCVQVEDGPCSPGPTPRSGGTLRRYCHLRGWGVDLAQGFGPLPGAVVSNLYRSASCLWTIDYRPEIGPVGRVKGCTDAGVTLTASIGDVYNWYLDGELLETTETPAFTAMLPGV